jgi:transcriptional regulator with GAF, ATPase, and Fis domain/tetratricopeptide (TPR) repeat protein
MENLPTRAPNLELEAFRLEKELAQKALLGGDREAAWNKLFSLLIRLSAALRTRENDALFVTTSLELCDLGFVMGKGFGELTKLLQDALAAAERLGDRRSWALIKLHLGRLYYFGERRHEAIAVFAEGKQVVEELGDEDILTRAAEFLGLFFFVQGLFSEATIHFERAVQSFENVSDNVVINPSAPIWLGYCAAYMGEFHRSVGILDYYHRVALEKGDRSLAATIRAVMGIVLVLAGKKNEAAFHLSGALQEAMRTKNALALFFTKGGLAYHHTLEGRLAEARELLAQASSEGAAAGLIRQYASPMVLEMLYEFHRAGLPSISELDFHREIHRILLEPNIHLRGVALRLRAMDQAGKTEPMADLHASEEYLIRAGAPVELAKTRLELARFSLRAGDHASARKLAQKAWMALSGYGNDFFPDDLRHLLAVKDPSPLHAQSRAEFLAGFTDIIQELTPAADLDVLLTRAVVATNRYFGAERGGIFWFRRRVKQPNPVLRATCNLSPGDVVSENFRSNLALVFKAYQENAPQVVRLASVGNLPYHQKAILCLPFEVEGAPRGVLYHDNSYLDGCFDFLDASQLAQMARYLSTYVARVHSYCLRLETAVTQKTAYLDQTDGQDILTRSPLMQRILAQADRVAASDGTVLISGETGVGKELLARRIHRMSPRRDYPLVTVDPTTIPENLVESELFGHEKGAFTGADRQKKGRMELAHGGTLFIDEVGEIPKSTQVKLLRVLQEKTLVRVGGTQTISSDFRLVAATNRDLAEEVAAGRFREDLFYRLNVVPIVLPPLRERIEDVLSLAQHFLSRYAAKYNRPELGLTEDDEARLRAYNWPGNVRELKNVIERAVILSSGERLMLDLPVKRIAHANNPFADLPTLDEIQRRYITFVLDKAQGQMGGPRGAAQLLGMRRSSLYSRMKKLGIR